MYSVLCPWRYFICPVAVIVSIVSVFKKAIFRIGMTRGGSYFLRCPHTWFGVGGSVMKKFTFYLFECDQSIKIGSTLSL